VDWSSDTIHQAKDYIYSYMCVFIICRLEWECVWYSTWVLVKVGNVMQVLNDDLEEYCSKNREYSRYF
jgi:hypothetical protein